MDICLVSPCSIFMSYNLLRQCNVDTYTAFVARVTGVMQ